MSPSDIVNLVSSIVFFAAAFVIAYRALRLRKVLVDGSYRRRAFWTAAGGLTIVSVLLAQYVDSVYGSFAQNVQGVIVQDIVWGLVFFGLYGWIASNIGVAISADFFNRDALAWRKGGKFVTAAVIFSAFTIFSVPSWLYPKGFSLDLASVFLSFMIAGVVAYSAATLAVASRRIRDMVIKRYTVWVALSVLFILSLVILLPSPIAILPMAAWVYCMHQAVGSLAIRSHTLPGLGTPSLEG